MNIISLLITHNTTLTAVVTLGLGVWVYFDKRNDPKNVALGTMLLASAMWTFTMVLWRNSKDADEAIFWLRTMFFVGSFIPLLFLIFSLSFRRSQPPSLALQALAATPQVVLFVIAFYTTSLVAVGRDGSPELGLGRLLFAAHFALLLVLALGVLFVGSRMADEDAQSKLLYILIGAIIAFNSVFGVLFGTTFTKVPDSLLIANVGLVTGLLFMASAILHKRFLSELRLLGPQLFALLMLFVVIFNIVVTETTFDLAIRMTMILILACYAGLTTRTMLRQVRHAQQVEVLSEQTLKMNEELIMADKMKTRFVSLASHQLRAPITGVRMYLQMLSGGEFGKVSKQQHDVLGTNITALNRLSETIDTFLDAAKIQLGKLELYKNDTSIAALITRVVDEMRPVAAKKGLTLTTDIARDLPDVSCDEGKIMHVLVNLIDNAVKYTVKGGVTISAVADGGIKVTVRDTGIGLSPEEKMQVADVFQRGMIAVRLDTGGSGLGLYIIKNLLDAHGAKLDLDSEGRGKGTTASFKLPLS